MQIPILTLHFSVNYGAVLQTYATCEAIRSLGHDPIVLDYTPPAYRTIYSPFRHWGFRQPDRWNRMRNQAVYVQKFLRLHRFQSRWLPLSPRLANRAAVRRYLLDNFDRVVVGSDQVWNTRFLRHAPETTYFLDFLRSDDPLRRHSFSSCFGSCMQLPDLEPTIRSSLRLFDSISVRNGFSANMVRSYAEREPEIVCDPTVLSDFTDIAGPSPTPEPYLLVYGVNMEPAARLYAVAKPVAQKHGLRIVVLGGGKICTRPGDMSMEVAPPEQWLAAFRHATCVVTNSFHGLHFAMKYHKPFFAFGGGESARRLTDLLASRGMLDRIASWHEAVPDIAMKPLDSDRLDTLAKLEMRHAMTVLSAICEQ